MSEVATVAGGCFWCLEAVFERLAGVSRAVSGYTGGSVENPGDHDMCSGTTGDAVALQVTFDPAVISYEDLLEIFFAFHDPTTLNRQGPDQGTQYRSAIFYYHASQKAAALRVMERLTNASVFDRPIVTERTPLGRFFPAEAAQPYCQAWVAPKVAKLRSKYAERLKG